MAKIYRTISFLVISLFLICSTYSPVSGQGDAYLAGVIHQFTGSVQIIKANGQERPAEVGTAIYANDTILTGRDGFVELFLNKAGRVHVQQSTRLVFQNSEGAEDNMCRMSIETGEIMVNIVESETPVMITTPAAIATGNNANFTARVMPEGNTVFTGLNGSIEVTAVSSGEVQVLTRRNKLSTDRRGQVFTLQQISNQEVSRVIQFYNSSGRTGINRPDLPYQHR
jgi:hypothetical protein